MDILIIRIGRLGDIVMILPALKEIRLRYPNARLHLITSPDGRRLFKTLRVPFSNLLVSRNRLLMRALDHAHIKQFIRGHEFDHIFCFERKRRTASWLPAYAQILPLQLTIQHYAKRCVELVTPTLEQLHQTGYMTLNQDKKSSLLVMLKQQRITSNTVLIGFHPTYSGFDKLGRKREAIHRLWPWQNFAELGRRLRVYAQQHQYDIKIVMDLMPNEQPLGRKIQQASEGSVILLPTEPDFERYLLLIERLNALVVPNTGVMHLAAALNTPMVALFSELNPLDCGPYMSRENVQVLRAEETRNPERGLAAISVDQVFDCLIKQLQSSTGLQRKEMMGNIGVNDVNQCKR